MYIWDSYLRIFFWVVSVTKYQQWAAFYGWSQWSWQNPWWWIRTGLVELFDESRSGPVKSVWHWWGLKLRCTIVSLDRVNTQHHVVEYQEHCTVGYPTFWTRADPDFDSWTHTWLSWTQTQNSDHHLSPAQHHKDSLRPRVELNSRIQRT